MASLQEILAAKKAAAAHRLIDAAAHEAEMSSTGSAPKELKEAAKEAVTALMEKPDPQEAKKEEPAVAVPKALSFAEKMALKKNSASGGNAVAASQSEEKPAPTPAKVDTGISTVSALAPKIENAEEKLRTGQLDATLDKNPMPAPEPVKPEETVNPEVAQAYADIKARIDTLNSLSGENLEGAMKELKKALMQNPAAVSLMEDTDIGQLVIALRKITGEGIAEASKEGNGKGTRTKKVKTVDLSDPNAVANIFDEL